MGGEDDGVILSEVSKQVSYLNYLLGVKSYRGLVKNDYLGASDKSLSDTYALTVAL